MRGCGRSFVQARNQRKHEAKCTHKIAVRSNFDESFHINSLEHSCGSSAALRSVSQNDGITAVGQKFTDECRGFEGIEDRQRLVDSDHFLETADEVRN